MLERRGTLRNPGWGAEEGSTLLLVGPGPKAEAPAPPIPKPYRGQERTKNTKVQISHKATQPVCVTRRGGSGSSAGLYLG